MASWCRFSRNTTACSSSPKPARPDGFRDRHHQRPIFHRVGHQGERIHSVVLDNKDATSGVNATVDLGAAVSSASAIYLQGTPAGNLTAAAGNVTLAGAQVTAAGVWNRNPPYIQATSGNTVSVFVPPRAQHSSASCSRPESTRWISARGHLFVE